MAGITHLAVGLAAKKAAPRINVFFLIVAAYVIDLIWYLFFVTGVETETFYLSHSLLMSLVWSLMVGGIAYLVTRRPGAGLALGLMVFSHWMVDFISHPMTAVMPEDTSGLPLAFAGSPEVGLGVWRTLAGAYIGEFGSLALGIGIFVWYLVEKRKKQKG